ncbi:MAG: ELWxxDGT repeat protein [Cystobacter sp.]
MLSWSASLALLLLSTSGASAVPETPEPTGVPWTPCGRSASLRADVASGMYGSVPRELLNDNRGLLFFTADDGVHGRELWASSGPGGTGTFLVKDIRPGTETSVPSRLVQMGGWIYFAASDGESGSELWRSDGTEAGTVRVKDARVGPEGSFPEGLVVVNGVLYFTAEDGEHGRELWRSDGTEEGTYLAQELVSGPEGSEIGQLTAWGRSLAFVSFVEERATLWRTDAQGTLSPVYRGARGTTLSALTPLGNRLFFLRDSLSSASSLEVADVVTARTSSLRKFPGAAPHDLTVLNGLLFFGAGGQGGGLAGDASGDELWKSDGTPVGTVRVADIRPGEAGSNPREFALAAGQLLFSADDGVHGRELWRSDGSAEGTSLVMDVMAGAGGSEPSHLTSIQGRVFFSARQAGLGRQVWSSDGSGERTWSLEALAPDDGESEPGEFVRSGWDVFFTATDWRYGRELWSLPFRPEDRCVPPATNR